MTEFNKLSARRNNSPRDFIKAQSDQALTSSSHVKAFVSRFRSRPCDASRLRQRPHPQIVKSDGHPTLFIRAGEQADTAGSETRILHLG